MMKCIDCECYWPGDENTEPGCCNDGDVSNPEQDVYCGNWDDEKK